MAKKKENIIEKPIYYVSKKITPNWDQISSNGFLYITITKKYEHF